MFRLEASRGRREAVEPPEAEDLPQKASFLLPSTCLRCVFLALSCGCLGHL